jgi:hypothetical protein
MSALRGEIGAAKRCYMRCYIMIVSGMDKEQERLAISNLT